MGSDLQSSNFCLYYINSSFPDSENPGYVIQQTMKIYLVIPAFAGKQGGFIRNLIMFKNTQLHKITIISILLLLATGLAGNLISGDNLKKHPVRFAVIGDRTGSHVPGIYGQIVLEIERLKPDFVLTVGDMIEGYNDDTTQISNEWEEYLTLVEPLTAPIYYTAGNHDLWSDLSASLYAEYIEKPYYSFNHRDLHFVFLDNSRLDTWANLSKEQMKWLKKDLKKNRKATYTFVFYHKPFWFETIADGKPGILHDIFLKYGVDAVFTGHYHRYFSGKYDGILYTSLGSSGGGSQPAPTGLHYHFAWVTVDEQDIHIAPIKMGSVLTWDDITAADWYRIAEIYSTGIEFAASTELSDELILIDSVVTVNVNNSSNVAFQDELAWEIPEGWTIDPVHMELSIPAGELINVSFNIHHSGRVKSIPKLSVDFPYAPDKTTEIEKTLSFTRTVNAGSVGDKPIIDGKISELIWKNPITHFFGTKGGLMDIEPVEFYFAHDEANLFIAARCSESAMDSLAAKSIERDGPVYGEDCVGFFFQPDRNLKTIYQVYFNPLGIVFDQRIVINDDNRYEVDREWNGTYEIKTVKGDGFWSIEARIPFSELGVEGTSEREWGINFRRKQARMKSTADWLYPISYDPSTFGVLVLE